MYYTILYYTLYNTHICYTLYIYTIGYFTGICAFIWAIFGTLFGIFYEKWSVLQSVYFAVGAMSGAGIKEVFINCLLPYVYIYYVYIHIRIPIL